MDKLELMCYEKIKRVYICHPYRKDPARNVKKVEKIVAKLGLLNAANMPINSEDDSKLSYLPLHWDDIIVPISPMLAFPPGMSELKGSPVTKEQGMSFCLSLLFSCHELWVYAKEPTEGMVIEIEASSRWGLPVIFKV